jgi:hypothetical protein
VEGAGAQEGAEKPTFSVKGSESTSGDAQSFGFQAETKQLLEIVQHSLYSDREVFLRELVSNSCDALEKARHAMVTAQSAADGQADLGITITVDVKERLLSVADNGIGLGEGAPGLGSAVLTEATGGSWTIAPAPSGGAEVRARITA